jgi:phage regulator Rha-like protein
VLKRNQKILVFKVQFVAHFMPMKQLQMAQIILKDIHVLVTTVILLF